MPARMSHPPGAPSWASLSSPDLDASVVFYSSLFGWDAITPRGLSPSDGYVLFVVDGRRVAGLGPAHGDAAAMWTTYVTVRDADATADAARAAGARVLIEPLDVLQDGRAAVLFDPGGAAFALWQPRDHKGAQLVDEPGTLTAHELVTAEPAAAAAFYGTLFGWHGEGDTLTLDDRPVATVTAGEGWPHWRPIFAVADARAAAEAAAVLGGTVAAEPWGGSALLTDPHGAVFGVVDQPATG